MVGRLSLLRGRCGSRKHPAASLSSSNRVRPPRVASCIRSSPRSRAEREKIQVNFLRLPLRAGRGLADQFLTPVLELAALYRGKNC